MVWSEGYTTDLTCDFLAKPVEEMSTRRTGYNLVEVNVKRRLTRAHVLNNLILGTFNCNFKNVSHTVI